VRATTFAAAVLTGAALLPGTAAASTLAQPTVTHTPLPGEQRFGVRLVDVPLPARHNPRGLRYIIDFVYPGTVIRRRIMVLNEENHRARFAVYPDAAVITRGKFIGAAGETRSELTSWVTVQHPSLTLRAHHHAMDLITIRVPPGATRGEHYGVIWAQQTGYLRTASGVLIKDIARVGVRIYLAVGRGGALPTRFAVSSVTVRHRASGQPYIVVRVRDTGQRAVDITGTARLDHGPGGSATGPVRSPQTLTLAPGQDGDVTFTPPRGLPAARWLARITLVSGFTTRAVTASLRLGPKLAPQPSKGVPAMTWVAAVLVALAVLGAVTLARARARRRARA
jgi:hypothetical protein